MEIVDSDWFCYGLKVCNFFGVLCLLTNQLRLLKHKQQAVVVFACEEVKFFTFSFVNRKSDKILKIILVRFKPPVIKCPPVDQLNAFKNFEKIKRVFFKFRLGLVSLNDLAFQIFLFSHSECFVLTLLDSFVNVYEFNYFFTCQVPSFLRLLISLGIVAILVYI